MQIVISQKKLKQNLCFFLTFSIVFLTSSMAVLADIISSPITIAWWIICAGLLIMSNRFVNKRLLICIIAIYLIIIVSTAVNGENVFNQIKVLFSFFVILLYVSTYTFEEITKAFSHVVLFIATISIPLYFVCLSNPPFLDRFIIPGPQEGHLIYNLYIYCFDLYGARNSGMFWEPGAFTTFLNLALLLELLDISELKTLSKKILILGILMIANMLTFSTTGYIAMAIVFVIYLMSKRRSKIEKMVIFFMIISLICVALSIYSEQLLGTGGTFGKLGDVFNGNHIAPGDQTSASIRIYSITKPLEIFLQYPLFGVGVSNLAETTVDFTKGAITCTFVNWFAIYGIFYGILMLAGYIKIVASSNRNPILKVLIFIFLMICIISENYATNACFVGIALLGFKREEENKMNLRGENEKQSVVQR